MFLTPFPLRPDIRLPPAHTTFVAALRDDVRTTPTIFFVHHREPFHALAWLLKNYLEAKPQPTFGGALPLTRIARAACRTFCELDNFRHYPPEMFFNSPLVPLPFPRYCVRLCVPSIRFEKHPALTVPQPRANTIRHGPPPPSERRRHLPYQAQPVSLPCQAVTIRHFLPCRRHSIAALNHPETDQCPGSHSKLE